MFVLKSFYSEIVCCRNSCSSRFRWLLRFTKTHEVLRPCIHSYFTAASSSVRNGHSVEAKTKFYTSREKELIRVIGQFFSEVGLPETAKCLVRESQCRLEHPAATKLRHHVINGNWRSAEACLDELQNTLNHNTHLQRMRYLLYEQKYLELLDDSRIVDAIKCLRKDLAKIPGKQSRCHYLASLAMYTSKEDLRKYATWPGKGKTLLKKLPNS